MTTFYGQWRTDIEQTAEMLSDAGFFYEGKNKTLACIPCLCLETNMAQVTKQIIYLFLKLHIKNVFGILLLKFDIENHYIVHLISIFLFGLKLTT